MRFNRKPHGTVYLGSVTLPFRDFSFVLKVQAGEVGMTGMREAVVLDEALRTSLSDEGIKDVYYCDKYDKSLRSGPVRNMSEDEKYDAKFPDHHLSRGRRQMHHLLSTIVLPLELNSAAPFGS
jgi:hypothetical protein